MDDLTRKYIERINAGLNPEQQDALLQTRQYQAFKQQYMPKHLSFYERACNFSAKLIQITPSEKDRPRLEEAIRVCHLETTPEGVSSFALVMPLLFILAVAFLSFLLPIGITSMTNPDNAINAGSKFILAFGVIAGLAMILPLQRLPFYLANSWRMKASNQMVLCTFYMVTYMRHTSNLELAIDFAGEHLAPPLSLDMKKVIWDIETQKYDSVKESLDAYLLTWREWNPEFIEAMHLIEGSLLESSESRRVQMLDKSLSVMLDETYEKMLHYAHNLKSPLTTLHMLGVILPILGLVILPLMVNFMPEVRWYHMAIFYNIALPALVYLVAKQILSTRPTGYGSADITEINPELKQYQSIIIPMGGKDKLTISPMALSAVIIGGLLLIAFLPFLYHMANPGQDWVYDDSGLHAVDSADEEQTRGAMIFFLDYRLRDAKAAESEDNPRDLGPNGTGAVLLSLFIPLALGLGVGMYYTIRSREIMKIREETRKLEQEFASALFQLGNRLADGLPTEIAFAKVADVLEGTPTANFFDTVTVNINKMGMSLEEAIFDEKQGAILQYPSAIIESSMKVLVESSKKGPLVASQAVINVSEYIKQMHRVDERLKDLLSEVISSMKSQINFLTPVIAGIVVGITSMIASILGTITKQLASGDLASSAAGTQSLGDILGGSSMPIYHFQAIVGLYVVQITIILTIMVNGVENGADDTAEQAMLGTNLLRATLLYVIVAGITILLFSFISGELVKGIM